MRGLPDDLDSGYFECGNGSEYVETGESEPVNSADPEAESAREPSESDPVGELRKQEEFLVLGSLLMALRSHVSEVVSFLKREHFRTPGFGAAYAALVSAEPELGEPRKVAALRLLLESEPVKAREIAEKGDAIAAIIDAERNWEYPPHGLHGFAVRLCTLARAEQVRGISAAASDRLSKGLDPRRIVPQLVEELQDELRAMQSIGRDSVAVAGSDEVVEAILAPEQADTRHLTSGWLDFDRRYRGLAAGKLVVVAARPAVGKTTFALNWALKLAMGRSAPPLFISLEMSREELERALFSAHGAIDEADLRSEPVRVRAAAAQIASTGFRIADPTSSFGIEELEAAMERHVAGGGCRVVVVDYLTLMRMPKAERRDLAVGDITRRMKQLAREHAVPVVVLSQLNRGVESREGQRPRISDLRDSGSIEQDADDVLLLSRAGENRLRVDVAKQRNGGTGDCQLTVLPAQHRLESLYDELD